MNNNKPTEWNALAIATLLQAQEVLKQPFEKIGEGKAYTRQGMIKQVLAERQEKAAKHCTKLSLPTTFIASMNLRTYEADIAAKGKAYRT